MQAQRQRPGDREQESRFSFDSDCAASKSKSKSDRRSPFDSDRCAIFAQGRLSTRPGTPGLAQDDSRCWLLRMTLDERGLGAASPRTVLFGKRAGGFGLATAVSEIPCPIKAIFRVVASWGRDDLAAVNADTLFPKPL